MPYLGNHPTANFASVTKDTFSGNASTTAFTLSKTATTNGVAVYVENVRQIPTTAYSVSGTTLTFTAAPTRCARSRSSSSSRRSSCCRRLFCISSVDMAGRCVGQQAGSRDRALEQSGRDSRGRYTKNFDAKSCVHTLHLHYNLHLPVSAPPSPLMGQGWPGWPWAPQLSR